MSWLILLALLKKLDKKIDDLETVTFRKVDELPATGEANVIYFVPKTDAEEGNYSDEYIWDSASESYEQIGDSMVDPLPEVTAADNGKVLGVANGEWGKVENPKEITIYEFSQNTSNWKYYLRNGKTWDNIRNDINNGKIVYLNSYGGGQIFRLADKIGPKFVGINYDPNITTIFNIFIARPATVSTTNEVSLNSIYINKNLAPDYTSSNTYNLGDLVIYKDNLYECTTAITTIELWNPAHWTQVKVSDELDKKANLTDIPADANHNIASAYDSTATYAIGDLCIYNGNLYECSTAISTAEAWDSTHWTQKTVAQELANAGTETVYYYVSQTLFNIKSSTSNNRYKLSLINGATWYDVGRSALDGKNVILAGPIENNRRSYIPLKLKCNSIDTYNMVYLFGISGNVGTQYMQPTFITLIMINFAMSSTSSETDVYCKTYIIPELDASVNRRNKFLKTNSNGDEYLFVDSPVPAVTSSDQGKALLVNSSGNWVAANLPTELPSVTSSDEGKVLTVNSNGQWVASALPDGTNQQY